MSDFPRVTALIPSRLSASRLPHKPLLCKHQIPLIVWVYQRAVQSGLFHQVLVVAEDQEIVDAVARFGGQAIRSLKPCQSGSQRIAYAYLDEAKEILDQDVEYLVNLQGDEPCFDIQWVKSLIDTLVQAPKTHRIATLVTPIAPENLNNRNRVKCVFNHQNEALYFSRQPIGFHQHIGIYGFHRSFMPMLFKEKTSLAIQEDLEQLTWMEMGEKIKVAKVLGTHLSIDTIDDYHQWLSKDL